LSRIRLYFDEVVALRARRVDVLTAAGREMIGRSDEDHLSCAASDGRLLYGFNIKDFFLLPGLWISTGRQRSGIVIGLQQRYSIGEQLRRLLQPLNRKTAEEMPSRLEYLSTWGR